jgi:hypothetical protein
LPFAISICHLPFPFAIWHLAIGPLSQSPLIQQRQASRSDASTIKVPDCQNGKWQMEMANGKWKMANGNG